MVRSHPSQMRRRVGQPRENTICGAATRHFRLRAEISFRGAGLLRPEVPYWLRKASSTGLSGSSRCGKAKFAKDSGISWGNLTRGWSFANRICSLGRDLLPRRAVAPNTDCSRRHRGGWLGDHRCWDLAGKGNRIDYGLRNPIRNVRSGRSGDFYLGLTG